MHLPSTDSLHVFGIKDLEHISGIKAHTIRVWEQRYSFLKPRRTATRIRYYTNSELKIILDAALLLKYGYKISQIDKLEACEIQAKIGNLGQPEVKDEILVNELIHCMIELEQAEFARILTEHSQQHGIDKTIRQLIYPCLDRSGILHCTAHVHPAQESLISNILRQKIITGIEGSVMNSGSHKKIILFLPEGLHRELGLLYTCYLLKRKGCKTIYLGPNVPIKDIQFICKSKKPHFLCTHLSVRDRAFDFKKFIKQVDQLLPSVPMVISGQAARAHHKKLPPHVHLSKSLPEVIEYVTAL